MELLGGVHSLDGSVGGANGGARKKMFKKEQCSPGENDVNGSCLDDDIVLRVGKAINRLAKNNTKLAHVSDTFFFSIWVTNLMFESD